MKKHSIRFAFVLLLSVFIMLGCDKAKDDASTTANENITASIAPVTGTNISNEMIITDTKETATKETEIKETNIKETELKKTVVKVDANYDPDFEVKLEAEEAAFTGNIKVEKSKKGFTGKGYLSGMKSDQDTITFTVEVPGNGAYNIDFVSAGDKGHKENNVFLDDVNIGLSVVDKDEFSDVVMKRVYMTAGKHHIKMTKSWGWVLVDSLIVTASEAIDETVYNVSAKLVDKEATDNTKRLMQYLTDMYGKYTISGQYGDLGIFGSEFKAIYNATGKYPAMLGLDFIEYTPSRAKNGSIGYDVDYAIKFHKKGGIVTFCWHWNAPEPYLINSKNQPWWKGFYTEGTTIDLKKIMDGKDKKGYKLLIRDIDAIAVQLKRLQKEDIPILWRPLHEASGGWFWWGASGSEAYIKLYQLLYDRLTNYHEIHNLIWVWNGQNKDWYPGDEYVDIVGTDIYPGEKVYSSQVAKFNELMDWNKPNKKIIAMTENGCMFDPDLALRDGAMWSYFGTWEGEFITEGKSYNLSEQYTQTDMLKKVYSSDQVVTLDELPDLETYDIKN